MRAANATEIPYDVIVMKWSVTRESAGVSVPLLVTKHHISDPILGNNVIEHVIAKGTDI